MRRRLNVHTFEGEFKEKNRLGSQQILSSMGLRWSVVDPPELVTPLDLPIRTYTIFCVR
jgi:hypothetical protein